MTPTARPFSSSSMEPWCVRACMHACVRTRMHIDAVLAQIMKSGAVDLAAATNEALRRELMVRRSIAQRHVG